MAYSLKIQAKDLSREELKLEPAWWKYKEILEAYPFKKELRQGYLNYHFRPAHDTFLNIFLDQLSYLEEGVYQHPKWKAINEKCLKELKDLIEHPEKYTDLEIIIYEWES